MDEEKFLNRAKNMVENKGSLNNENRESLIIDSN